MKYWNVILVGLSLICLFVAGSLFIKNANTRYQHFSEQADSFRSGQLDISASSQDLVEKDGKFYWPQGPFPSIFLLPFKYIVGSSFTQVHGQVLCLILLAVFSFLLARKYHFSAIDSYFLALVFLFGSMLYPLLTHPTSWYFSQIVATTLGLVLLYEYETRKRPFIVGLLLAFLAATRPTAALIGIPLFVLFLQSGNVSMKMKKIGLFLLPLLLVFVSLLWFNYARFGNAFDNGYMTNNLGPTSEPLRKIGLFSPQHIPMNTYWYFFASVSPVTDMSAHLKFPYITYSVWGVSFFLVAPFFLFSIASIKKKNMWTRMLVGVVLSTTLILLMYFNTGWYTYGPRYMADILPILFILLLTSLQGKNLSVFQKFLIIGSVLFNSYLLWTSQLL